MEKHDNTRKIDISPVRMSIMAALLVNTVLTGCANNINDEGQAQAWIGEKTMAITDTVKRWTASGVEKWDEVTTPLSQTFESVMNTAYRRKVYEIFKGDEIYSEIIGFNNIIGIALAKDGEQIEGYAFIIPRKNKKTSALMMPKHMFIDLENQKEKHSQLLLYPIRDDPKNPMIEGAAFKRLEDSSGTNIPGIVKSNRRITFGGSRSAMTDVIGMTLSNVHELKKSGIMDDLDLAKIPPLLTGEIEHETPVVVVQWQWNKKDGIDRPVRINFGMITGKFPDGTYDAVITSTAGESGGLVLMINPKYLEEDRKPNTPKWLIVGFISKGQKNGPSPGATIVPGTIIAELLDKKESIFEACAPGESYAEDSLCKRLLEEQGVRSN